MQSAYLRANRLRIARPGSASAEEPSQRRWQRVRTAETPPDGSDYPESETGLRDAYQRRYESGGRMREVMPGVIRGVRFKGDRSAPAQIIQCSGLLLNGRRCGKEEAAFGTARNPLPPEALTKIFQRRGWLVDKHGRHKCIECQARDEARKLNALHRKETEVSEGPMKISEIVADPTLRKPSLSDNRRIRQALDDAYDEEKQRYSGNQTDQSIGAELGVPWAWVRSYREEHYGPLREGNLELVRLKSELGQVRVKIEDVGKEVEKLIDRHARLNDELTALARRIVKIEDPILNPR
jgi:hypothetical protein